MQRFDTDLGGGARQFPNTTWGMLSRIDAATDDRRAGMELLCRRYWKPVYHFVRTAWARSSDDAKDLTQGFLSYLIEEDALARYDKSRGSFRTFLKTLLRHFASNEQRAALRLKRGGGARIVPIDLEPGMSEALPDPGAADPEKALDRAWMVEVVNRAASRVRESCRDAERKTSFKLYEEFELATPAQRPTLAALGAGTGLSADQVQRRIEAIREEIRAAILAELSETTLTPEELREEWAALFGS